MDPCSLPTCFKLGIDPIAIHLGAFALYWYGLLVAVGFIVAIRIGSREAEKTGINPDQLLSATLVAALFGLLMARVFYVLQNQPQYYIDGKHLGEIPLADLVGTGLVLDLRPITGPWSYYSLDDVLASVPAGEEIGEGDIVVLFTGLFLLSAGLDEIANPRRQRAA